MKRLLLLLAVPVLAMLTGCPYNSKVTLSEFENSVTDKKLYGEWEYFGEDGTKIHVLIRKGLKNLYAIKQNTYEGDEHIEEAEYRGHFTPELGMINLHKADSTYNFFKFEMISKEEFAVDGVEEDFMKKNLPNPETKNQQELYDFVKKNLNNSAMYEEQMRFYKVGSKSHAKKKW